MSEQLGFPWWTLEVGGTEYVRLNRTRYWDFCEAIQPDLTQWEHVYERLAFAILSANARFENTARALTYVTDRIWNGGVVRDFELVKFGGGITGNKAGYLNLLKQRCSVMEHLKREEESWTDYRSRLARSILGLGITKASFAACLLYPLEADVCCLDVWMCRALGTRFPNRWTAPYYESLEGQVRQIALSCRMPMFPVQWSIWSWARGRVDDHQIFKGYKSQRQGQVLPEMRQNNRAEVQEVVLQRPLFPSGSHHRQAAQAQYAA